MEIVSHTLTHTLMEKISKSMRVLLAVLDYCRYFLLVSFAIAFGFLAMVALIAGEFNIFSLFGFAGCAFVSWTCWSIRRD